MLGIVIAIAFVASNLIRFKVGDRGQLSLRSKSQLLRQWWSQKLNPGYLRDKPSSWGTAGCGRSLSALQEPGAKTPFELSDHGVKPRDW